MRKLSIFISLLMMTLSLFVSRAQGAEEAGVVIQLIPPAWVERGDERVLLSMKAKIMPGDVIYTGEKAKLQMLFTDDSILAMGPKSSVTVDDYVFNADENAGEMAVSIGVGIMRMVSGKIVEANPDAFSIKSPLSNIGIRGTMTGHVVQPSGENHVTLHITSGHQVSVQSSAGGAPQIMTGPMQQVNVQQGSPAGDVQTADPSIVDAIGSATTVTAEEQDAANADAGGGEGGGSGDSDDGGESGGDSGESGDTDGFAAESVVASESTGQQTQEAAQNLQTENTQEYASETTNLVQETVNTERTETTEKPWFTEIQGTSLRISPIGERYRDKISYDHEDWTKPFTEEKVQGNGASGSFSLTADWPTITFKNVIHEAYDGTVYTMESNPVVYKYTADTAYTYDGTKYMELGWWNVDGSDTREASLSTGGRGQLAFSRISTVSMLETTKAQYEASSYTNSLEAVYAGKAYGVFGYSGYNNGLMADREGAFSARVDFVKNSVEYAQVLFQDMAMGGLDMVLFVNDVDAPISYLSDKDQYYVELDHQANLGIWYALNGDLYSAEGWVEFLLTGKDAQGLGGEGKLTYDSSTGVLGSFALAAEKMDSSMSLDIRETPMFLAGDVISGPLSTSNTRTSINDSYDGYSHFKFYNGLYQDDDTLYATRGNTYVEFAAPGGVTSTTAYTLGLDIYNGGTGHYVWTPASAADVPTYTLSTIADYGYMRWGIWDSDTASVIATNTATSSTATVELSSFFDISGTRPTEAQWIAANQSGLKAYYSGAASGTFAYDQYNNGASALSQGYFQTLVDFATGTASETKILFGSLNMGDLKGITMIQSGSQALEIDEMGLYLSNTEGQTNLSVTMELLDGTTVNGLGDLWGVFAGTSAEGIMGNAGVTFVNSGYEAHGAIAFLGQQDTYGLWSGEGVTMVSKGTDPVPGYSLNNNLHGTLQEGFRQEYQYDGIISVLNYTGDELLIPRVTWNDSDVSTAGMVTYEETDRDAMLAMEYSQSGTYTDTSGKKYLQWGTWAVKGTDPMTAGTGMEMLPILEVEGYRTDNLSTVFSTIAAAGTTSAVYTGSAQALYQTQGDTNEHQVMTGTLVSNVNFATSTIDNTVIHFDPDSVKGLYGMTLTQQSAAAVSESALTHFNLDHKMSLTSVKDPLGNSLAITSQDVGGAGHMYGKQAEGMAGSFRLDSTVDGKRFTSTGTFEGKR